eukprot:303127_1
MAQQFNMTIKSMPNINIDCLKSMSRYLKKSNTYFELQEDKYCSITKGNISLKIFAQSNDVIITQKNINSDNKFEINSMPKQYHYLYWLLFKMVKKIRKKTIKYTIIRKRELDKTDKITCLISLSGAYTIHFKTGAIAYIHNKNCDIKFIQNNKTKTIPFTYRNNNKCAVHYNDAFDTLRNIVHELIHCADIVEKQKLKQLDYSKTWKITWNVDTGSVEDITESIKNNNLKKHGLNDIQQEGLFKCNYQSDTTVSSDYSDTNSEIICENFRNFALNQNKIVKEEGKNNESLSTVDETNKTNHNIIETSYSSINSIKSEASWRQKLKSNDSIERNEKDKQIHLQYITSWTKQDVCCWL